MKDYDPYRFSELEKARIEEIKQVAYDNFIADAEEGMFTLYVMMKLDEKKPLFLVTIGSSDDLEMSLSWQNMVTFQTILSKIGLEIQQISSATAAAGEERKLRLYLNDTANNVRKAK